MKTFVGDIGTEILLDSGSTITDATVQKIYYKKPQTGDKGFWVGSIKDTTKVSYTILVDDLDESGEWVLQIY
ncbi:hypothetical protein KAR91_27170, partial [Candidatus Pacearchaeota archaeon]|nr:hypothetical protein [Candidatus Pacearchaeota archaeon]